MVFVEMQSKQWHYSAVIPSYKVHYSHQLLVAGVGGPRLGVDGECIPMGSGARGPHWVE